MASRQMAFQLTEYEYVQTLGKLVKWFGDVRRPDVKIGDVIDGMEPDERKRERIQAVLVIAVRCYKEGIDPTAVRKLVCWRNEAGRPSEIEAVLDGRRPLAVALP